MGDWDRALTHLNVARDLDPESVVMAQAYQEILQCEALRNEVFKGKRTPLVFGDPVAWLAQMLEALRLSAQGEGDAAQKMRNEALEAAPAISGTLTISKGEELEEVPFEWLTDGDSRLGPVLEMVVNGRYYWAPYDRIAEVTFEGPSNLRDIVWTPAQFRWTNEGEAVGVIPTRYVGSENDPDDAVKLSRKTSWNEVAENTFEGIGQRVFMTDLGEYGLMDLRRIVFNNESAAPEQATDAG